MQKLSEMIAQKQAWVRKEERVGAEKKRERSRGKLGKKKAEEMSEPYGLPRVNRYYILKDNGRAPSKASVRAGKRQKEVKKLA